MSKLVRKKTCSEILLEQKLISEEQVEEAIKEANKNDQPLQQIIIDMKLVSRVEMLKVLSNEWGVRAVDLSDMEIDPEVVKLIPEAAARRHLSVPFAREEDGLFVAMADPRNFFIAEDIHLRTGCDIQPFLAMPDDVLKEIDKAYGVSEALNQLMDSVVDKDLDGDLSLAKASVDEKVDISEVEASAPEVEKIVNAIVLGAIQQRASDIHVEPFEGKVLVRYRVDGVLRESSFHVPNSYKSAIIAKIKIMTESMDITERRRPQDGRIQLLSKGKPLELRVNIIPSVYGESCVMRLLDRSAIRVSMAKLGILPDVLERFQGSLTKPNGLILVSGPTGSGKSTTLYAALNFLNKPVVKILTVENPVEYNLEGVVQLSVNPEIDLDFATALRAFLRQDPDIIMIGEIRDKETATIALEAAMTGHLVLSTIHTNDAPSTIARLAEMGIHTYLIASSLECVLAQRLVRAICPSCKEEIEPSEEIMTVFTQMGIETSNIKLYQGRGCNNCNKSGYKGRIGIHEFLFMDDNLRSLVLKEVSAGPIRDYAIKNGMRTLWQDGLEKIAKGWTTLEEVVRVSQQT
ncbi:MAG: ATPase, T2SS/T4P/T4SS family [Elusimicrobiota bacterium]